MRGQAKPLKRLLGAAEPDRVRQGFALLMSANDAALAEELAQGVSVDDEGRVLIAPAAARKGHLRRTAHRTYVALAVLRAAGRLDSLLSLDLRVGDGLWREDLPSVDVLSGLSDLRTLNLQGCGSLSSVDGLSGLTNLRTLNLSWCSLSSVDVLSGLTNLRTLDLGWSSSLTNPDALSRLTRLETLELYRCTSLTNVDFLSGLTSLRSLDLGYCASLENVDGLAGLTGLETLDLVGCGSLSNVDGLADLTGLRELDLTGCDSLELGLGPEPEGRCFEDRSSCDAFRRRLR